LRVEEIGKFYKAALVPSAGTFLSIDLAEAREGAAKLLALQVENARRGLQ
jgi:hypothetical protein